MNEEKNLSRSFTFAAIVKVADTLGQLITQLKQQEGRYLPVLGVSIIRRCEASFSQQTTTTTNDNTAGTTSDGNFDIYLLLLSDEQEKALWPSG